MKTLFDPIKMGSLLLKNRIAVAPTTRCRCFDHKTCVPNDLYKKYYEMRAGFGLIIAEASQISQQGTAFPRSPGIYTKQQVEGWKKVIDAVHVKNGVIVLQLFHCGRVSSQELTLGVQPIAPSAILLKSLNSFTNLPFQIPKTMTKDDINKVLEEYRQGAINAKEAGFDGVELHGANGYLIDQFLRDGTNKREDEYGGSIENRCRLCLEVMDQLTSVFGKGRVGIRISPTGRVNDMFDSAPIPLYSHLLRKLDQKGIAFVEIKEATRISKEQQKKIQQTKQETKKSISTLPEPTEQIPDCAAQFKGIFKGTMISNDGMDFKIGTERINEGLCNIVSFGKMAISNPDLVQRFKNNWPLNKWKAQYFYTEGELGFTDYPLYKK